jgi:hypothetical protein
MIVQEKTNISLPSSFFRLTNLSALSFSSEAIANTSEEALNLIAVAGVVRFSNILAGFGEWFVDDSSLAVS